MSDLSPGDLVTDTRGVVWFVHGNPQLGLFATSPPGTCVPVPGVLRLYGPLTMTYRPGSGRPATADAGHGPGFHPRSPG
ncbi:hypothetical protein FHS43_006066 [Streptosporangium becharense]|uniref:Uncharacterized protein n=1 Tax=Streptosporangium becharense TaxID=1816182 RepID=A0A7W9IHJ1_9ACTN|nr:hypothetical protein [Streptosporangium becharense]MBB2914754.1 hypothetical protein [Streptosporangium becharense]MBB5820845.1 hypothetical protein [Streptosporangium becharense]